MKKLILFGLVFLLAGFVSGAGSSDLDDALFYWSMDDDDFTGVNITDLSGNGHNGIGTNGTKMRGFLGILNASTNHTINASNYLATTTVAVENVKTINFWMNPTVITAGASIPFSVYLDTSNRIWMEGASSNTSQLRFVDGGTSIYSIPTNKHLGLNSWTMVTILLGTGGVNLYLNGTLSGTHASTATIPSDHTIIRFGQAWVESTSTRMTGRLDEISMYDYRWNATQIAKAYNNSGGYNPYPPNLARPVISEYNLTSGWSEASWDNSSPYKTNDSTPTFNFDTNLNANCRSGKVNYNFTDMTTARNCSSGDGTKNHTCTLISSDSLSYLNTDQNLYFSCVNVNSNNQTANATSVVNVTIFSEIVTTTVSPANGFSDSTNDTITTIGLTFDGVASNRTYEYETTADLGITITGSGSSAARITFNCSATTLSDLKNISIYLTNSSNKSFSLNKTTVVRGTANKTNWTLSLSSGVYTWGCLGSNGWNDWSDNRSIKVTTNDTACLDIIDNTNDYMNYSCSRNSYSVDYKFNILRINKFSDDSLNCSLTRQCNITIDNRSEIADLRFNLNGSNVGNLTITLINDSIKVPGVLIGLDEYVNTFTVGGALYSTKNISFVTAESKSIYLNLSTQGNLSRTGFFNFTMMGYDLDFGNDFSYTNNFTNLSVSLGTDSGTDSSNILFDHFSINNSVSLNRFDASEWTGDQTYSGSTIIVEYSVYNSTNGGTYAKCTDKGVDVDFNTCYSAGRKVRRFSHDSGYIYFPGLDLKNVNSFNLIGGMYVYASAGVDALTTSKLAFYFSDLGNESLVRSLEVTASERNTYQDFWFNMTGYKIQNNWRLNYEWKSDSNGVKSAGNVSTDVSVANIKDSYYFLFKVTGTDTPALLTEAIQSIRIDELRIGGISVNRSEYAYRGTNFSSEVYSGNYTSEVLNITSNLISRAILNATVIENTSAHAVDFYLSNDNGTTYEEVTNGEMHTFSSFGKNLSAMFFLNSTSNYTSPIILGYSVEIIPSALEGVLIQVGNNKSSMDINYILNASSTPLSFNGTDVDINNYIESNCNVSTEMTCILPITFVSDSGGTLQLSELNSTQDINPVSLTHLSEHYESKNIISFTSNFSNGIDITMDNVKVDFRGSKNISINLRSESLASNYTIFVRYSPINITFPSGSDYWMVFPTARNQSNVEPFGQNSSDGIWEITTSAYTDSVDIYVRYNESVNSCVTKMLFSGMNLTLNQTAKENLDVILNTSNQIVIENISLKNTTQIFTYTDVNCSGNTDPFYIPYFCFNPICSSCVITSDFEDECYWSE